MPTLRQTVIPSMTVECHLLPSSTTGKERNRATVYCHTLKYISELSIWANVKWCLERPICCSLVKWPDMKKLQSVSALTFTEEDEDFVVVYGTEDTKKKRQEVSINWEFIISFCNWSGLRTERSGSTCLQGNFSILGLMHPRSSTPAKTHLNFSTKLF